MNIRCIDSDATETYKQCSILKAAFVKSNKISALHITFFVHYNTSNLPFYKHFSKSSQNCSSSIIM
jgi:hypothetical protein